MLCQEIKSETIGGYIITSYTSETLEDYLFDCKEIVDISEMNGFFYVGYLTNSGKEVLLCYQEDGLYNKSVYENATDTAYIETTEEATVYENFRNGSSYEMSDELLEEIDACIVTKDWETLNEIECIDVDIDENGLVSVIPTLASSSSGVFSSEAEQLQDLKAHFPQYTNKTMQLYSKYSAALGENVSITVVESRNAYVKKSGDWHTFVVGTALTAIATFIGIATTGGIGPVVAILTLAGVEISAAQTIMDEVTLSNGGVYEYFGERAGYAYDKTIYNDAVRVIQRSAKGEFAGGYTSDGDFEWVHSVPSLAYNHSYDEIANDTIFNYNADIEVHGFCSMYRPDNW